jgi:hypothetical protein
MRQTLDTRIWIDLKWRDGKRYVVNMETTKSKIGHIHTRIKDFESKNIKREKKSLLYNDKVLPRGHNNYKYMCTQYWNT